MFVRRLAPTTSHFFSQRVRQAYDEQARPGRLVPFLAVVPTLGALAATRRWTALRRSTVAAAGLVVTAAEIGRRRDGGRARFPARCSLAAPLWVAERSVCVRAALFAGPGARCATEVDGSGVPRYARPNAAAVGSPTDGARVSRG